MTLEIFLWMLGSYAVGTWFGHRLGFRLGVVAGTAHAITTLRTSGYLRWRVTPEGLQLVKFDEPIE